VVRYINVKSRARTEFIDITEKIQETVRETGINSGICTIFVPIRLPLSRSTKAQTRLCRGTFRPSSIKWSLSRGTTITGKAIPPPYQDHPHRGFTVSPH